jgi:hypothetical protein
MLVEFQRDVEVAMQSFGEDDGLPESRPLSISVNPQYVASITPSTEKPNVVIMRLCDGRGYAIRGEYNEVKEMLEGQGGRLLTGPGAAAN